MSSVGEKEEGNPNFSPLKVLRYSYAFSSGPLANGPIFHDARMLLVLVIMITKQKRSLKRLV